MNEVLFNTFEIELVSTFRDCGLELSLKERSSDFKIVIFGSYLAPEGSPHERIVRVC